MPNEVQEHLISWLLSQAVAQADWLAEHGEDSELRGEARFVSKTICEQLADWLP